MMGLGEEVQSWVLCVSVCVSMYVKHVCGTRYSLFLQTPDSSLSAALPPQTSDITKAETSSVPFGRVVLAPSTVPGTLRQAVNLYEMSA